MENKTFFVGMGLGMVAGGALSMVLTGKTKKIGGKHMVSRCLHGMGDVIDDVTRTLGM